MATVTGLDLALSIDGSEIVRRRNVDLNMQSDEVDDTSKVDDGWKNRRAGLHSWDVTFEYLLDDGDTTYSTLFNAWRNRTELTVTLSRTGETLSGSAEITEFSRTGPYTPEGVTHSITIVGKGALSVS